MEVMNLLEAIHQEIFIYLLDGFQRRLILRPTTEINFGKESKVDTETMIV